MSQAPLAHIGVIGAGAFGTALAAAARRTGARVSLWGRDAARIEASSGSSIKLRDRPAKVAQHTDLSSSISFG